MSDGKKDHIDAWGALLGTHALATRRIEAALKAAGMPPLAWYDVLLELERAGGRLRIGALAERIVIEPYNMTRLLDRLEQSGCLTRERSTSDRRSAFAVLTKAGEKLRGEMWPTYRRAILDVMQPLTESEAATLSRTLRKMTLQLRAAK
jgi:DNA-binding MarR family transcriptional regulator